MANFDLNKLNLS